MSEEIRLSVGIDASPAKDGSDQFDQAAESIVRASERIVDRLDLVVEQLSRVAESANGERLVEYVRTLESAGQQSKEMASDTGEMVDAVSEYKNIIRQLTEQQMSSTEVARHLQEYWRDARDSLRDSVTDMAENLRRGGEATGDFSYELSLMARTVAEAGDAVASSKLFDMADEFREMEQHIADALTPGSELLRQFEEAAGLTAGEVQNLYNAFGSIIAESTDLQLALQNGSLTVEEYALAMGDVDGRIQSLLPRLAELRNELQFETNAEDAAKEIEDMMDKLGSTQASFDQFTNSQKQAADAGQLLNNSMTTLGVSAGKLGGMFLRALGITGLSALFYKSMSGASQFADALVRLTNMANLTNDEVRVLTNSMKELAREFGNSSNEEAAAALAIMSKGYRDAASAVQILAQANQLADATFTSVGTAAASLSQAMAAFELTAKDAKDAAETLAVASGGSAEAMQQMAFMAGRLGAVMNQAGVSLEDYSVAVAALRQGGMENRRAIMGLTQAVGALSNMSTDAKLRFKEYGIAVDEARIANEGLAPILQEIYAKTNGSKQAIQQLMGSQQAATVVMALMRNEGELYAKALENMANKSALTAEAAERVNNTFTKQADNLQNRLLDRFKNFGTYLLDKLVPIMKTLNEHVEAVFRTMAALLTLMASTAAFRAATFAAAGFSKALATAQTNTSGLRLRLLGTGAAARAAGLSFSGATVQVSAMSVASNIAARAVVGLATAFNLVKAAMGGWIGVLLTLGVTLYAFKASADSTSKSLSDLTLETKGYAGALELLNRQELQSEQLKATKALADSKRELLAEEAKLADLRRSPGLTDTGAAQYAAIQNQISKVADLTARTKEYETQLRLVLQALYEINNQTLNMTEAVGKGKGNLNILNQKELEEAKQAGMADPVYAAQKKRALLQAQIDRFDRAENLSAEEKAAATRGLQRELEALNVEMAQLAQKRGVFTEFARGVIGGVDPATAALFAYEDKLKQLEQAHALGLNTESYDRLKAAAEVAYLEASRAAQVYQNELKSVVAATSPVEAAMQAYADAALVAHKAALAGASDETIQKFMNQQAAALGETVAMYEAQGDSLDALTAQYNPLVAIEQQHEAALIAVEKAAALTNKTDKERDAIIASVTTKINLQYEATRRLTTLQEDKLLQLAAQYDPLIANELARTKALLEMEQAVRLMTESEETRALVTEKVGALINEQFDREADGIKGSIKLSREWQVAWEESIKRLDTLFVDLWKSAFQSFSSFKDQMIDMAKSLAAEMAHAAFTKPIMVKLAQLFQPQTSKEGVGGTLRDLLMGRMGDAKKPLTAPQMANAVEEGTYRGTMKAQSALAAQGLGGDTELLSAEELFGDIGSLYKGTVGDLAAGAKKITEAFESLSVEGLSGTLQKTLAKYFPQAGGAMASAGVVPSGAAGGGLINQLSNIPGFGTLLKGIGKLAPALGNFSAAFSSSAMGALSGTPHIANLAQLQLASQSGAAGWGAMAGQAAAGAGVGMVAGWATNEVLGSRGNAGRNMAMSAIGGAIGSFWGPPGMLIGGAVGSLVDNMIGGGEEIKDFGYKIAVEGGKIIGTEYEKIKKYGSMFSSKTVLKESEWESPVFVKIRQQFKAMTQELENVAEVLDVSTEALKNFSAETIKISTKGKKPEQIEAELGQAMIDLQGQQIAALIKDTAAISPMFQQLLGAFTATGRELIEFNPELKKAGKEFKDATHYTEEFIAAFQQLAMLQAALNAVPSAEGQKMLDEANKTLTERYHEMVEATLEVAQGFDGTIEDIGELTAAFVAQRQAAIELAAALKQTQKDISEMFADTALSIRESLMTPQELYESRRSRVDDLSAQLVQTTDPGKLLELSQSINAIVGQLYQGLDETQRQGMAAGFLSFLDGIDAIVRAQTEQGLTDLDNSATGINEQVITLMTGAATQQTVAANNFADGVAAFVNAVATFAGAVNQQGGGGTTTVTPPPPTTTFNIRGYTREVNA